MKRPLLIILILLVIGGGFGYIFVWPNYQKYTSRKAELQSITAELSELKTKESFIKELEAAEPILSLMSDQALVFIPVEEERERFSSELDALAKANSLTLTTLTFSASEKKSSASTSSDEEEGATTTKKSTKKEKASGPAPVLNYTASVLGSYASVEKFLKELEQTKRYTIVKTFEATGSTANTNGDSEAPAETQVNVAITGSIFTKPLTKKFAKDQKFSTEVWQYLLDRTQPVQLSGASNPFAP